MPREFCLFLDENHCNNKHVLALLQATATRHERHSKHFRPGTPDADWLPLVGENHWALLTSDRRIRYRAIEKQAVRRYAIVMFYFSSNNLSGKDMSTALAAALPSMLRLHTEHPAPFIASINRDGVVAVRDSFADE